jgi:hypothetical protein
MRLADLRHRPAASAKRIEFRERQRATDGGPAEPPGRLGGRERAHLDLGEAPAGARHRRVQPVQVLVGGDRDQYLPAPAEDSVGEVEQPGQRLPGGLLGLAPDQLVAVLQDQQPPAGGILVVPEDHVHEVAGIREEPLRVQHAIGLAPVAPPAGQGAQEGGLASARRAMQEQQPPVDVVTGQRHEAGQRGSHRGRVVSLDDWPGVSFHGARGADGAAPA